MTVSALTTKVDNNGVKFGLIFTHLRVEQMNRPIDTISNINYIRILDLIYYFRFVSNITKYGKNLEVMYFFVIPI